MQKELLTKQDQIVIVANEDQLEDRLSFEAGFATRLLRVMNRQASQARQFFATNGFLLSEDEFRQEMQERLFEEYIRTMDFSISNFRLERINDFAEQDAISEQDIVEFRQNMMFSLLLQSEEQANRITRTTFRQYNEELVRAEQEALADEEVPVAGVTTAFLANEAFSKIRELNNARSDLIAVNEVTRVSEDVKFNMALTIQRRLTDVGVPANITKRWRSTRDGRVRDAHVIADGQIQNLLNPFLVANELLNYPGDVTLGASVSNFIRCRCWAVYEIRA